MVMDVWKILNEWAEQRLPSLTITLVKGSGEIEAQVGQMALLKDQMAEPLGPLTETPWWGVDWEFIKKEMAPQSLAEQGLLLEVGHRTYYLSPLIYERRALILGGGHVGRALAELLLFLEYKVTVMDDREEFLKAKDGVKMVEADFGRLTELFGAKPPEVVTILTRGHAQDTQCLRQVLSWPKQPAYLGMIGSRSRTARTLKMLAEENYAPELLAQVHTPIGLNIGAQTPAEIAVSIAAQIIEVFSAS